MSSAAPSRFPPGPSTGLKRWSLGPLNDNPLDFFTKLAHDYGDVSGLRILNFRTLFINHPDMIEDLLVNQARKFVKGRVLQANKRVFGEGLLTAEGDFWLRQRRLAQPAFHRARITAFAATMVDYSQLLIANWRGGEVRDIHAEMMRLTLQIVGKTLFNADVDRDAQSVGKALHLLLELAADFRKAIFIPQWLPTPTNIRTRRAIAGIEAVLYRIIAQHRAAQSDSGDFLSMLLAAQDQDGSRMTDRQVRDESITLFLAGHETTANNLSWTWWLLAQNPEAEGKLHAELDSVLGDRPPTFDDLASLTYTGHILSESMRLYPPAWGMARLAVEDTELAGYPVTKGMGVAFAQWTVHRDSRWYDSPEEFIPERWQPDRKKPAPKFAYFPFGGGPRQCIGNTFAIMEATLCLATIAQKFRFSIVPDHPVVPLASITLRPRHGIRMLLHSRNA